MPNNEYQNSSNEEEAHLKCDFETLALLYLEGLADQEQLVQFNYYLHNQPNAAAQLTEIAALHAQLRELGHTHTAQPIITDLPINKSTSKIRTSARRSTFSDRHSPFTLRRLALAAIIVITIGALALSVSTPAPNNRLIIESGEVELTRAGNNVTISESITLLPKDQFSTRANSRAVILTDDGSRMVIAPNSQIIWQLDQVAIHLDTGSILADITPQPSEKPFRANTSHANITVIGTRFSLTADQQLSILDVDHGSVRIENRNDQQSVVVESQHSTGTIGSGMLTAVANTHTSTNSTGLTGDYFNHLDFTQWTFRRIDEQINFDWLQGSPDPRIARESFSVRWRGYLIPPVDASYTFFVEVDDGARLWIGNHLLIDRWGRTSRTQFSDSMTLNAGQPYAIQLDYFQEPADSLIKLHWSYPGQSQQIIPSQHLRPMNWESDK